MITALYFDYEKHGKIYEDIETEEQLKQIAEDNTKILLHSWKED